MVIKRLFLFAFLLAPAFYTQAQVASGIPEAVKLSRNGIMPAPAYEVQYMLGDLSVNDNKDIFPAPPCLLTGEYNVGFQLYYDLGDRNTTINWASTLQITVLHAGDSVAALSVSVDMASQTFLATDFYDSLIACGEDYRFLIKSITNTGAVPQDNIYLKVLLYKKNTGAFNLTAPVTLYCSNSASEIDLHWTYDSAAVEFDVEWVYIAKHDNFSGTTADAFLFKEPVRVTTAGFSYTHQLFYDSGQLWYRIRAVSYNPANPDHRIQGEWFHSGCTFIDVANPEPKINWQGQTVFAEEGKNKKVVSYFDGSMRQRQGVTNLSTENLTLVGESLYDFEGRKSVDILPVPAPDASLHYKPAFNSFYSGNSTIAANVNSPRDKFHYDNYTLENSRLDSASGAGQYYSSANIHNGIHKDYIPAAKGYAYSQTEYTNDGTGRVRRQSGVGEAFKMDGNHTTRYFYASAGATELARLFGTNAGKASHYKKNMVVDPNGQVSVTYQDQEGRTVATALAGDNPQSVDPLSSYTALSPSPVTVHLDDKNRQDNGAVIVRHTFLNATPNSPFDFDYNLSALASQVDSVGCVSCVFDLEITLSDPDGTQLNLAGAAGNQSTDSLRYLIPGITAASCTEAYNLSPLHFTVTLATVGDYTLTKKLTPRELTFEQMSSVVALDSSVQTAIRQINGNHVSDSSQCVICDANSAGAAAAIQDAIESSTSSDCDNIYQQILADMNARNANVDGYVPSSDSIRLHPLYCQYALCNRNQQSDIYEKQLVRIPTWSAAVAAGYSNGITTDPFFQVDSLSGYNYKAQMQAKLNSVVAGNVGYDSNGDGVQDGTTTYSGALSAVTDPLNTAYYVDAFGNHNATNGNHLLYARLMSQRAQMGETVYQARIDSQRWTFYRGFYVDAKRRMKLEIPAYTSCAPAAAELGTSDALPQSPDSVAAWAAQQAGVNEVSDPEIKSSLYSISNACGSVFSATDSTSLSNHLQAYFNSTPNNFFHLIIQTDVGVNADLVAIQGILNNYSCSLDSVSLVDPTVGCAKDSTVTVISAALAASAEARTAAVQSAKVAAAQTVAVQDALSYEERRSTALNSAQPDVVSTDVVAEVKSARSSLTKVGTLSARSSLITLSSVPSSSEYDALMALYTALGGSSWTHNTGWSTADPDSVVDVSLWYGITTDANGHVIDLVLNNNNLTGYIPSDIGDLSHLEILQLVGNPITGSIPARIGDLTNLQILQLNGTPMTGSLPAEIGNLTSLRDLEISASNITGQIPAEIGGLTSLTNLYFFQCNFTGTLPAELGNLTALTSLTISGCPSLTGKIPSEIGQLTNLNVLSLGFNNLTDSLPSSIGNLSHLQSLYLWFNSISGHLPSSIGNLTNLVDMRIGSNSFSGPLPVSLASLPHMVTLFLDHSSFSGSIPYQLGSMTTLQYLELQNNNFTGTIPTQLGNLTNVKELYLSANNLTGSVPSSFVSLPNIYFLDISMNHLSGPIPLITSVPRVPAYQNKFTFADLVPARNFYSDFVYTGQDSVGVNQNNLAAAGMPFTLTATIDRSTSPASVYRWYKENDGGGGDIALNAASTTSYSYTFTNPQTSDNGKYYYTISNSAAPDITRLVSRTQRLTVATVPTTTYNFCVTPNPNNTTLQSFSYTVDWNQQVQQCMASQAQADSILTELAVAKLMESQVTDFYNKYSTQCLTKVTDHLSYTYVNKEYHYTLYYYDQAGSLVQTVPPEGVHPLTTQQTTDVLAGNAITWTGHSMATKYRYNSLNQLTGQKTPDADTSIFYYNSKGQLRFSRNAQQLIDSNYSYSKYDALGRIVEVGQMKTIQPDSVITQHGDTTNFPVNGDVNYALQDVTLTHYDLPNQKIQSQFAQQNLRTRVAWVEVTDPTRSDTVRTYYSYDIHGNVNSMVQSIPGLKPKRTDYTYDLISGKVNYVLYQFGDKEQFVHRYEYDADNRITDVFTSTDRFIWNKEANYKYNLHGPLARTELGEYRVQGLDYTYTLQGWIKGVNMPYAGDPGGDGENGSVVGKDVFAYNLGYYQGDYTPVNTGVVTSDTRDHLWNRALENIQHTGLYNGNISSMTTDLSKIGEMNNDRTKGMQGMVYRYDQLNRIKKSRSLTNYSETSGFAMRSTASAYDEDYSYDANGNILTLQRNDKLAALTDDFNYTYYGSSNKLQRHKTGGGTYAYDSIGNLISDTNEGVTIAWTPYGKVRTVTKGDTITSYRYDASGNRIEKKTTSVSKTLIMRYLRDAGGNVMTIYKDTTFQEQPIYGNGRIGQYKGGTPEGYRTLGKRTFELSNHLGNVLTTITDKVNMASDSVWTNVASAADYYPFGLEMKGRAFSDTTYRYGFNGKEKDDAFTSASAYDYGFRIYNPHIAKFLSVDPLTKKYPELTPYQFASDNPIANIDVDGLEGANATTKESPKKSEPDWQETAAKTFGRWVNELMTDKPAIEKNFIKGASDFVSDATTLKTYEDKAVGFAAALLSGQKPDDMMLNGLEGTWSYIKGIPAMKLKDLSYDVGYSAVPTITLTLAPELIEGVGAAIPEISAFRVAGRIAAKGGNSALVNLTEETFSQALFKGAEDVGGYSVYGSKGLVGNTFNRNIFLLEAPVNSTLATFRSFVGGLESEALGAGANKISIYGSSVVKKGFLNPKVANRFGYSLEHSGSGVFFQKALR